MTTLLTDNPKTPPVFIAFEQISVTPAKISEELSVTTMAISNWKAGRIPLSIAQMDRLCIFLGKELDKQKMESKKRTTEAADPTNFNILVNKLIEALLAVATSLLEQQQVLLQEARNVRNAKLAKSKGKL